MSDVIKKKMIEGFTVADLSGYVRDRVKPDAKVFPLKKLEWVEVGSYKILLLDLFLGPEDAYASVLVAKHNSVIDEYLFVGEPVDVADMNVIKGTNLLFDMWFSGNGSYEGVALLVEADLS